MKKKEWFASWFDTPYYHLLYSNRTYEEAERFIESLLQELRPSSSSTILDLACGKGRHAYYLAKKKLNVIGVDYSEQSILWAQQHYQLDNLQFERHDMREVYKQNQFDYVFNFFTSFGYFKSDEENQQVINAMHASLKTNGIVVIDFLNAFQSRSNMVASEVKVVEGIEFNIKRDFIDGYFVKDISFVDKGESFAFQERVQALNLDAFKKLFAVAGLELMKTYGNYALEKYEADTADRLIMILRKHA